VGGKGTRLKTITHTIPKHPLSVSIAEGFQTRNSFLGPFSRIAVGTVIEHSSVGHTLTLEDSRIYPIERLGDSLVATLLELRGADEKFNAMRIFAGCDSRPSGEDA
jgi:hypothetical protein